MQSRLLQQLSPMHIHDYDLHLPLTSYKQCINSNHFSLELTTNGFSSSATQTTFTEGMEKNVRFHLDLFCVVIVIYHVISLHEKNKFMKLNLIPSLISLLSVRIVNFIFLRRNWDLRYDNFLTTISSRLKTVKLFEFSLFWDSL